MSIITELQWRGITPPPAGRTTARTTCPVCSPYRVKRDEACARITITSDTSAKLFCYHCGADEFFEAATTVGQTLVYAMPRVEAAE